LADVANDKMTFIKSVDVRGNTDESWSRAGHKALSTTQRYIEADAAAQKRVVDLI
jgi:outer membrane protein OmpA-like peptidoglycan-associated protein